MKYHLKVYYKTELMEKVTEYTREILPDWEINKKELIGLKVFEINTKEPLTEEEKEKLLATKEDWMEDLELVEV